MSQNGPHSGPPWSHGSSDEPYAEPADPWGDHSAAVPEQSSWGGHPPSVPLQPVSYSSPPAGPASGNPSWDQPPPPPPPVPSKRNTPILVLVVTLGVLIVIGLGTTAWLLKERNDTTRQAAPTPSATPAVTGPAPQGSEDARFYVKKGDCVVNEGSDGEPNMRVTACTSGTYQVLERVPGKTTGERDAERKCAKVSGYTKWFF